MQKSSLKNQKTKMKEYKGGFIPATDRKISKILREKDFKFIGKSADNLKLKLNLMPNMSVILF